MSAQLLITDANIIIDIKVGGLLEQMFQLHYEFALPTLLFEQELSECHSELLDFGLTLLEVETDHFAEMQTLGNTYKGVSPYDLMALILARSMQVPLLTGDKKLRNVCESEGLTVNGTLWLIDEMYAAGTVSVKEAELAYVRMQEDGSRLPATEIEKQLKRFKRK